MPEKKLVGITTSDDETPAEKKLVGVSSGDYTPDFKTGPQMKSDSGFGRFERGVMSQLPIIMGTLGGIAGGPMGAAAGGAGGAAIRNIGNPDLLDAGKDVAYEGAVQGATEGAAPYISKALSRIKDPIVAKLLQMFPVHDAEDAAAAVKSGIPLSVGQSTHAMVPQFMERTIAPFKDKAALEGAQQDFLTDAEKRFRVGFTGDAVRPVSPVEHYGRMTQEDLAGNIGEAGKATKAAFDKVRMDAAANTRTIRVQTGTQASKALDASGKSILIPTFEDVSIPGAIDTTRASKFAETIKPNIDTLYNNMLDADPKKAALSKFKTTIDQLATGTGGQKVMPWEALKEFRTNINNAVGSELDLDRSQGGLKKLATLLGDDIEKGVAGWEKNSPGSLNRLKQANQLHINESETFNPRVKGQVFDNNFGDFKDASAVFNRAKENPEAAAEMVRALGPEKQRAIKGQFFDNLLSEGKGNPTKALDTLENDPVYKKMFSSSDRADLTDFFRTMRRVQPDNAKWGSISLALKGAGVALGVGKTLVDSVSSGSLEVPDSVKDGALLYFTGRSIAKNILLNPRYGRAASRLAQLDPDANEAQFLRKSILTAMRGVEGIMEFKNGDKRNFTVSKDGQIRIGGPGSLDQNPQDTSK